MLTLEMKFKCDRCKAVRQYGTAENLKAVPELRSVFIRCAYCKTTTPHQFVEVRERDELREHNVMGQMKLGF